MKLHRSRKQPLRGFPVVLSVSKKNNLADLIPLWKAGAEFISTGGTLKTLRELGVTVTPVEQLTGAKPKFGGRIKTLDEIIFTMLLARAGVREDERELKKLGLVPMGLVVINPYPFSEVIQEEGVLIAKIIENIDIGGGAIPMAGVKGGIPVAVDPADYKEIVEQLLEHCGKMHEDLRDYLSEKTVGSLVAYYQQVHSWMQSRRAEGKPIYREPGGSLYGAVVAQGGTVDS